MTQRLHLVFGGEVTDPCPTASRDARPQLPTLAASPTGPLGS